MHGTSRKIDWSKLKLAYAQDARVTFKVMSQRYNIPESTIRWHASQGRWMDARDAYHAKGEERLIDGTATKDMVAMLHDLDAKLLQWNEEMRYVINSLLTVRTEDGRVVLRPEINLNDVSRAIAA